MLLPCVTPLLPIGSAPPPVHTSTSVPRSGRRSPLSGAVLVWAKAAGAPNDSEVNRIRKASLLVLLATREDVNYVSFFWLACNLSTTQFPSRESNQIAHERMR